MWIFYSDVFNYENNINLPLKNSNILVIANFGFLMGEIRWLPRILLLYPSKSLLILKKKHYESTFYYDHRERKTKQNVQWSWNSTFRSNITHIKEQASNYPVVCYSRYDLNAENVISAEIHHKIIDANGSGTIDVSCVRHWDRNFREDIKCAIKSNLVVCFLTSTI